MSERLVLTRAEAAKALGVSLSLIDELIRTRRLPCLDVGRRRLIPSAGLAAFVATASTRASRGRDLPDRDLVADHLADNSELL